MAIKRTLTTQDIEFIAKKLGKVFVTKAEFVEFGREVNERFNEVNKRFNEIDGRFSEVDKRFSEIEGRFDEINGKFNAIDGRFDEINKKFDKSFTKLDEILGEIRANRDERILISHRISDHEDRIIDLEEIHPGGKHPIK